MQSAARPILASVPVHIPCLWHDATGSTHVSACWMTPPLLLRESHRCCCWRLPSPKPFLQTSRMTTDVQARPHRRIIVKQEAEQAQRAQAKMLKALMYGLVNVTGDPLKSQMAEFRNRREVAILITDLQVVPRCRFKVSRRQQSHCRGQI